MEKKDINKLIVLFGIVLLIGIGIDVSKGISEKQNVLIRNDIGEEKREEQLYVSIEGIDKEMEVTIDVEAVRPTQVQAEEYFALAIEEVDKDFANIEVSVPMQEEYVDGLVQAEWSFSPWDLINAEGDILYEEISQDGEIINATVMFSCGEYEMIYQFPFEIAYREKNEEEYILEALDAWVETEMQKEGKKEIFLPQELLGKRLSWSREESSLTLQLLLLEMVAVAVLWFLTRRTKMMEEKKRTQKLERDYPEIVGQLALLLGAGMNLRQAWNIIATRYSGKRQKRQVEEKEAFEGVVKMTRRIMEGENEKSAYQKFANEIKNQSYHRLIRLLIGNLEKGTRGMREVLEKESRQAYEQRVLRAKKGGEEASTRMLMPLMLMMMVVMAIVMMPALIDFAG